MPYVIKRNEMAKEQQSHKFILTETVKTQGYYSRVCGVEVRVVPNRYDRYAGVTTLIQESEMRLNGNTISTNGVVDISGLSTEQIHILTTAKVMRMPKTYFSIYKEFVKSYFAQSESEY